MIKIENIEVFGWRAAIRGMRNPMNSWEKSDSKFDIGVNINYLQFECYAVGPNDLALMKKLVKAGLDHSKFMRMINVFMDITAPLYWWKEFDTYKVGTVANSCSTMHKIQVKEFTVDNFSNEHLNTLGEHLLSETVKFLNVNRDYYLETKDKKYWWQMIQLLPSSYNQKRTVMLNYEVLANIYQHRRSHKLDEWREICKWIESLPYSEIITCNVTEKGKTNALTAAIANLKSEQWSEEEIVNLLLGQTKKEQVKLFADGKGTTPVHGGAVDIPAVMADGTKNY